MTKETMYLVTDIFFDTTKGGNREFDSEEASDYEYVEEPV